MLLAFVAGPWSCASLPNAAGLERDRRGTRHLLVLAPPVHHVRVPQCLRTSTPAVFRISDEFDLIDIADRASWEDFRRAAGIKPGDAHFDFRRGRVVGLVAWVGDPMKSRWPVSLRLIGGTENGAWLEARLGTEFFYRTASPGYATFTYVEGLAPISVVHLRPRLFLVDR